MASGPSIVLTRAEAMFVSPLLLFSVRGGAELNVRLRDEVRAERRDDPGVSRSNLRGWHAARDFFTVDRPASRELRVYIADAVEEATRHVAPGFDRSAWNLEQEGWINVLGRGGCHTPHVHPTFHWSGVYYVAVPSASGDSGALEFLDPRTSVGPPPLPQAGCFQDVRTLRPLAGQLVVFPSYVRHWVYPNESEEERISVAFNARWVASYVRLSIKGPP